ncbi:MAG: Bacterial lipid biosynthesis acyltransferase [Pyrinomonadaceae bacterium]|nr:Bacterial lipid biosynthesis acyltransferase [Pyrinomonadaceae bacterium]
MKNERSKFLFFRTRANRKAFSFIVVNTQPVSSNVLPYAPGAWWLRPREADRPALYWHVASRAFAFAMWLVPRRYRFKMATRFTAALTPIVKRTPWYRKHDSLGIDGVEEIALYHALSIMTRGGVLFDLEIKIEGAEILRAALRNSHGTLMVAPHALLSVLLIRYLHDVSCPPTTVAATSFVHIYGTRFVIPALQPSSNLLIRIRTALRRGDLVYAMIDEAPRNSARTIQFTSGTRAVYVSDALIKLAQRCDAGVIFTSARLDERQNIVLRFEAPMAGAETSELSITKSFVNFLETHVERRGRPASA